MAATVMLTARLIAWSANATRWPSCACSMNWAIWR